ncbi:MAG TPA: 4-hydroxy-tetrahydrodipicolinate reductase [Candidatus Tumulicola sp.]|nr:4-hydroxy-tetrahydrodipicolinate reductase [Candidatus Tumulicola sp.]
MMIRVGVAGAHGKMGLATVAALRAADDLEYAGGLVKPGTAQGADEFDAFVDLVQRAKPDVLVDFTVFPFSKELALAAIGRCVRPVIGTSGYSSDDIVELRAACERSRIGAVFAPNFALGAVLMMKFAAEASRYYKAVEIIEMHESGKNDAPSGTAMATARRLAKTGAFDRAQTKLTRAEGARGAALDNVGVHSLRLPGVVAHQEVLFGGVGETLSIRHDSFSRESFMPGVLRAVRAAPGLDRFVEGLEELL